MTRRATKPIFMLNLQLRPEGIGQAELLKSLLRNQGVREHAIVETQQWPYTMLSVYFKSKSKALGLRGKLRVLSRRKVRVSLKTLRKKDWQTKWHKEFKPFAVTKRFTVVPMWLKNKYQVKSGQAIYIDTSVAFGTGLHATTRFMAQFVDQYRRHVSQMMDIGTGTGILAMIASKCGAQAITAIDICPDAVNIARDNFKKNGCANIITRRVDIKKYKSNKKFDFVCANLITQDLIILADKIIRYVKPGKYLAVSGISSGSYDELRKAYACYPLRCVKIKRGEGWAAVLFRNKIKK